MPSSSSASITRFLAETTPGTIESGNPQIYRVISGGLTQTTTASEDNEIRADRGRGDSTLTAGEVGGNIEIAYSHKTHTEFLEGLLADDFVEVDTNGIKALTDAVFDSTAHTLASAGTELPVIAPGQFFQISGANTAANDGIYKATSATHTTALITVDTAVRDFTTDTTNTASISSSRLSQGNDTLKSFTLERELSDVTPAQFFTHAGCYVSSLSLNYAVGEKLLGSFGFMGTESEATGTASDFSGLSGEGVAATTTGFMNSVTNTSFLLDGVDMGESCLESLTINIDASIRGRRCVGSGLAFSSVGTDPFNITFSGSIYFGTTASAALYQKLLLDTTLTLAVALQDASGNGIAITLPRVKLSEATVSSGGVGSDCMLSLTGVCSTDTVSDSLMHLDVLGSTA